METLLTRRQTLQSLAAATVFGGSLFSLIGCGGGGNDGGGGSRPVQTSTTRVPVTLPSGVTLPLAELEAGTGFGIGAVDATGFQAKVNSEAPTFAYLRHMPSGKYVMFGMVGSGRPGVTPLGSAAATMAIYFGFTGYEGENVAQVLTLLENDVDVKALGETIAAAMASDPYALTNGNGTVKSAIKTTIEKLTAKGTAARAASMSRARADSAPFIQVQPSDEQGGARVNQGEDGYIVPTNLRRRPMAAYTYRVGHTPGAGAGDQSAPQRIDAQDIQPTGTILGQYLSLMERPAFAPVEGKPVELTVTGEDEKTHYETVVLMASGDNGSEPAFFSEGRYAAEVTGWRQKREELNEHALVGGILADVFKAASLGAGGLLSYQAVQSISAGIEGAVTAAANAVLAAARRGVYEEASRRFMENLLAGDLKLRFTSAALRIVGYAEAAAAEAVAGSAGAAIAGIATLFLAALLAGGAVASVADLGVTWADTVRSPFAVRWQETTLNPGVRINPRKADVRKGQNYPLSVNVVGVVGVATTYVWKLTGSDLANLSGEGKVGREIETSGTSVNLATTPSTQGTLKVTVEAKNKETGKSFGTDVATLTMVENEPVELAGTLEILTYAGADYHLHGAIVRFSPVTGATRYVLQGRGGNDTAYYGTTIDRSVRAPVIYDAFAELRTENAFGLSQGGGGGAGNAGEAKAYYQSRFGAFTFKVFAYFD